MEKIYDVIVCRTGAAGLFAALQLPRDYKVLMITKDEMKTVILIWHRVEFRVFLMIKILTAIMKIL